VACPFLDCIVVCKNVKNNVDAKESKKEEEKGKDDKLRGKENGVGSGVDLQAEGNSTCLCQPSTFIVLFRKLYVTSFLLLPYSYRVTRVLMHSFLLTWIWKACFKVDSAW
jgi:hypothetical protein